MTGAWRIASRNLRRNHRRNLATGLAVAFGVTGLAVLGGYITRVDTFLRTNSVYLQHGGHVVVYRQEGLDQGVAKPTRFSLTPKQQAAVRNAVANDPRIAFVAGYLKGMGLAGNGCRSVPFTALGIDLEAQRRILEDPQVTRFSADLARPARGRPLFEYAHVEGSVGVAAGLASLLGKTRIHDDFPGAAPLAAMPDCSGHDNAALFASDANLQLAGVAFDGSVTAMDGEIVNLFHSPSTETEDQGIQTALPTLQRLYDTDAVTYMAVFLHDWRDARQVASDLRERLRAANVPADVYEFSDARVSPYYAGSMAFLGSMGGFIVLIVATVVLLGVMNSTTLTVYERSRELGTLRALGYSKSQVTGLVVREVALVTLLGVLGGTALTQCIATAVRLAAVRIRPPGIPGTMQVVVDPGAGVAFAISTMLVLLALGATWAVARRRVRERTSDLLIATNT